MDYFLAARQEELDDARTIMVLGQIMQSATQPAGPLQNRYREQLIRQLRKTNLTGAAEVSTWESAVMLAE